MLVGKFILVAVLSYLLGCCNGAILVSKYILKNDIRRHGSGNAGLTNFYRVFGGKTTLLVIVVDMGKAFAAVAIGAALLGGDLGMVSRLWAALCVMLGHDFPCMFGFKGGKGVLSGGAVTIAVDWRLALVCWGLFLLFVILTRYVSLGSIMGSIGFIIANAVLYTSVPERVLGVAIGFLLVWGHRTNIVRLLHGNENKFSLHKKKES